MTSQMFTLPASVLHLANHASQDDLRRTIESVQVDFDTHAKGVTIVATNGHMLARAVVSRDVCNVPEGGIRSFLVPGNVLRQAAKVKGATHVDVYADRIEVTANVKGAISKTSLSTSVIESVGFPAYQQVFPKPADYVCPPDHVMPIVGLDLEYVGEIGQTIRKVRGTSKGSAGAALRCTQNGAMCPVTFVARADNGEENRHFPVEILGLDFLLMPMRL